MRTEYTELDQVQAPKTILSLPIGVNEKLMKLLLPISNKHFIAFLSVYTPTMTWTEDIRAQFSADLDTELRDKPATDKLVILGDFNARVGRDEEQWRGIMGKHGVGKTNSNDLVLLNKCAEHNLLITNTIFRLAEKFTRHGCTRVQNSGASLTTSSPANMTAATSSSPGQCVERSAGRITDSRESSLTSA